MNVWYDDFWYWEGFRVFWLDGTSIRVYKSDDVIQLHAGKYNDAGYHHMDNIPLFNVFNYSLAELEKKIKTYILFS